MQKRGVTLLELIIAIVIIGLLGGITMLSASGLPSLRLRTEADKIVSDISWARQMAVTDHRDYRVVFDTGDETYTIEEWDDSIPDWVGVDPFSKRSVRVDIASASSDIVFQPPFGNTSSASNDIIRLEQDARAREIEVIQTTGYARHYLP